MLATLLQAKLGDLTQKKPSLSLKIALVIRLLIVFIQINLISIHVAIDTSPVEAVASSGDGSLTKPGSRLAHSLAVHAAVFIAKGARLDGVFFASA